MAAIDHVKLMDSALSHFKCEGPEQVARNMVMEQMGRAGGHTSIGEDGRIYLDCSSLWRYRLIAARLVPAADGSWYVLFQEANASTSFRTAVLSAVAFVLSFAIALLLSSPWALLPILIVLGLFAWIIFSPGQECYTMMSQITESVNNI